MKSSEEPSWSIGELAERFELPTHVLRHWESEGLLQPARDPAGRRRFGEPDAYRVAAIIASKAGRRRFGEPDAYRVAAIIASKAAGMSLEQVRALLDATVADRRAILEQHLRDLQERITAIERSQHMTEHALGCRAHDISQCPNFRAGVADIVAGTRTGLWSEEHLQQH